MSRIQECNHDIVFIDVDNAIIQHINQTMAAYFNAATLLGLKSPTRQRNTTPQTL